MTSKRTRHPIDGPWMGTITLLLLLLLSLSSSESINSEISLNSSAASTGALPIAEEQSTIESKLAISRKIPNDSGSDITKKKHIDDEKIEEKRVAPEFHPELEEKEFYDEIDDLEDKNDHREPTTPSNNEKTEKKSLPSTTTTVTKKREDEPKKYDFDGEIGKKKNDQNNFSLINDTNVNYVKKKLSKSDREDENDPENPTNVINSGDDEEIERKKGPKSRIVEIMKNTTLLNSSRLIDESIVTSVQESTTDESVAKRKILPIDNEKMTNLSRSKSKIDENTNEKETRHGPKARTIGTFDDTKEILNGFNETRDSSDFSEFTGITEKSVENKIESDLKPYPYVKVARSNYSEILTEETSSALENTIGPREEEEKKMIVTESTNLKRSEPIDEYPNNETIIFGGNLKISNTSQSDEDKTRNDEIPDGNETNETMTRIGKKNRSNLARENSVDEELTLPSSDAAITRSIESNWLIDDNKNVTEQLENSKSDFTTENSMDMTGTTSIVDSTSLIPSIFTILSTQSSSTSEAPKFEESTTISKIEYEFVGLSENSTDFDKYAASTESTNSSTTIVNDEKFSFLASTSPIYLESSTLDYSSSSTTDIAESEINSSTENMENIETSTNKEILTTEIELDEDSTIFSITEKTTTEIDEISETTIVQDIFLPIETTTEIIVQDSSNFTDVTEFPVTIVDRSTENGDNGIFVNLSSTSIPEMSTLLENSTLIMVASTESSDLSISTDNLEFEATSSLSTSSSSSSLSSSITTNSSDNCCSNVDSSTEIITATFVELETWSERSSTSANTIDIVTVDETKIYDNRAVSQEEVTSLVKIIFEGSWINVCPHLSTLRQSLADLLTSAFEKNVVADQIIFQKNPCTSSFAPSAITTELSVSTLLLYVVDKNGNFDVEMTKLLPSLYNKSPIKLRVTIHSFQLVQDTDSGNAIAVVIVSCVALICLVLLAGLLFIMRKRQTRFNYGERCRPVSLDAYSLDSVSAYNSVRGRKGAVRASKRSYGNPTFEDSTATPSHPLNFAGLSTFCNEENAITEEFAGIPQVTARIDELPQGAEVKNRYANVVPLPETRVFLTKINNDPLTEYINASYVRGPKNATKYYIACQAPIESTVTDFWRMIWEQRSKVIIMLTDLVENGVEKCAEYIPPSEVTDCHRLFGDFQVTLKKRETKEKYAISTLHLKNLDNNTFREISHIWYLWPANGVQSDAAGLIAVLLEARAFQRGGPGPIVVHCSPGTGRTGTLIALDLGIRQYEITRTVDVPRVVYTIRRDRAGAVQTKEQYAFIYKALNLYATKLAGGALES